MENIAPALLDWFYANRRILPFREDPTPYHVWLSEIMLQQTRVSAALPYYERFLAALPDIPALAACEEEKLHKLWEGLGYYSRVRNLQKAARIVCEQYGGQLPADYDALRALPGIGDYTAGAVASISFGIPVPAVDGNVLRVFSRLYNDPAAVTEPAVKKAVEEYADRPGRILVAATPITIQGDKLHHLLDRVDKRDMVDLVALPKLVRFAEQEIFDQNQVVPYLKEALKNYPLEEYKAFVLGCTHFNYFKESYQEIFPNKIEFVDGNEGALRELIRRMEKECDTIRVKNGANDAEEFSKTDRVTYYFSGKQISAADQIRIDKYMCQLDRMALI